MDGDVLVLSTFFPKTPWRTDLAMARNPIIYGLANEIYVAESSGKGGTWSGVADGLRKKRIIYVRQPEISEQNANLLLIQKGAIPVDFNGNTISGFYPDINEKQQLEIVGEPEESIDNLIRKLLEKKPDGRSAGLFTKWNFWILCAATGSWVRKSPVACDTGGSSAGAAGNTSAPAWQAHTPACCSRRTTA